MELAIGIIFSIYFWIATTVLIVGVARKIYSYSKIPAPLKIPTTPAPTTHKGVVLRMLKEILLFSSLYRADKLLWLVSMLFHYAMLLIVLRHFRYVVTPLDGLILFIQPYGRYAGFIFVIALICLLLRRIFIDRVKYISSPSDNAMLLLLIAIGSSGLFMSFVSHANIGMVIVFLDGLMRFEWKPLPLDFILLLHLGLVATLMLIFPISKLLHAPGVFFSPTRNQVDNPREKRHLSPWAEDLEKQDKTLSDHLDQ